MKLIKAKHAAENQIETFIMKNPHLEKKALLQSGYVVEVNNAIEGCFVLKKMEKKIYWLRQLYITREHSKALPILLETILTLAKEQEASHVYVHSYQPMVDILLQSLQFHPQENNEFVDKYPVEKGNWWSYHVS